MKNILILLLIVTSFQTITSQNVTYGVKGGANFSSYIANYGPFDYNYKLGFQVGGFVKIAITDKMFLQPELSYSLQGTKFDLGLLFLQLPQTEPGSNSLFSDGNSYGRINESTIILPLMFKYYFTNKFNVEIGPQVDYLFNIKTKLNGDTSTNDNFIESSDSVSEFNFGINLGLGYEFVENLGLGFRYNYGFNHLHNDISEATNNKRSNSVFSVNLEYHFH